MFVHVSEEPIDGYFGPEKLLAVCELVRKRLSFLQERPFYFFVDDYSAPKISTDLQANPESVAYASRPRCVLQTVDRESSLFRSE